MDPSLTFPDRCPGNVNSSLPCRSRNKETFEAQSQAYGFQSTTTAIPALSLHTRGITFQEPLDRTYNPTKIPLQLSIKVSLIVKFRSFGSVTQAVLHREYAVKTAPFQSVELLTRLLREDDVTRRHRHSVRSVMIDHGLFNITVHTNFLNLRTSSLRGFATSTRTTCTSSSSSWRRAIWMGFSRSRDNAVSVSRSLLTWFARFSKG